MKIEIEFEMNQDIYFMKDNGVSCDEIVSIRIELLRKGGFAMDAIETIIKYTTLNNGDFSPGKVFANKHKLLESL